MDTLSIIAQLRAERDRLDKALEALEGTTTKARRGGPAGGTRPKHRLTPEGRRKLSMMMKRRWAERRKRITGPLNATKTGKDQRQGRKNRLSPEGRRKLSEMMKKRWAERRKKKTAA